MRRALRTSAEGYEAWAARDERIQVASPCRASPCREVDDVRRLLSCEATFGHRCYRSWTTEATLESSRTGMSTDSCTTGCSMVDPAAVNLDGAVRPPRSPCRDSEKTARHEKPVRCQL